MTKPNTTNIANIDTDRISDYKIHSDSDNGVFKLTLGEDHIEIDAVSRTIFIKRKNCILSQTIPKELGFVDIRYNIGDSERIRLNYGDKATTIQETTDKTTAFDIIEKYMAFYAAFSRKPKNTNVSQTMI